MRLLHLISSPWPRAAHSSVCDRARGLLGWEVTRIWLAPLFSTSSSTWEIPEPCHLNQQSSLKSALGLCINSLACHFFRKNLTALLSERCVCAPLVVGVVCSLLGCSLLLIRWFGVSSCLGKGRALHSSIHMDISDYSPAASCDGLKGLV